MTSGDLLNLINNCNDQTIVGRHETKHTFGPHQVESGKTVAELLHGLNLQHYPITFFMYYGLYVDTEISITLTVTPFPYASNIEMKKQKWFLYSLLKCLYHKLNTFCSTTFHLCLNCGRCVTTILELLFKLILLTQSCMHTILATQDVFHILL